MYLKMICCVKKNNHLPMLPPGAISGHGSGTDDNWACWSSAIAFVKFTFGIILLQYYKLYFCNLKGIGLFYCRRQYHIFIYSYVNKVPKSKQKYINC